MPSLYYGRIQTGSVHNSHLGFGMFIDLWQLPTY